MFAANLSLVLFKLLYFQVFNLYRDDLYTCYATGWEARCCLLRHFFGVNLPSQSCRWKLSWFHLAATICLVSKVPRAEVKGQNNLLLFCSDWLVMFYWSDDVLCSLCSVFVYSNGVHWIGEKDLNSSICYTKKSTKNTEPVDQNRLNHILATIHFDTRYFQGYTVLGIWHFRFFFFLIRNISVVTILLSRSWRKLRGCSPPKCPAGYSCSFMEKFLMITICRYFTGARVWRCCLIWLVNKKVRCLTRCWRQVRYDQKLGWWEREPGRAIALLIYQLLLAPD